jgi:tRNA (cmo5U34)-methyltransferase
VVELADIQNRIATESEEWSFMAEDRIVRIAKQGQVEPAVGQTAGPATASDPGTDGATELPRDQIFAQPQDMMQDFKFGADTAAVFDDMVSRSVPFYGEMQRMACELAGDFAVPGTNLYDMGCATGTTMLALDPLVNPGTRFVGVDNSDDMLDKARAKLAAVAERRQVDFVNADLNGANVVEDASVVLMLLTLQFVRPLYRERLVRRVYDGLRPNGGLILIEKITGAHTLLNRLFIRYYYDYKRRMGYSDLEISQKREALENVLIPYHYDENRDLLLDIGFRHVEEFFRWYNFCGVIAVK